MPNQDNKTLKQLATSKNAENPSQLGDPVSLKAETSDSEPTEQDRGAGGDDGKKSLKQLAEGKLETNASMLGDPVSLKAETADSEPTADDRGAAGVKGKSGGKSKL